MGLNQGVADQNSVFLGDEDFFFGQDHAAHAVGHARHVLAVELTDVLVAVGAVDAALVAVDAQIERSTVLDHSLVERRQHHVRAVVHFRNGNHQQAVLLAGVAAHQTRAVICPRLIRAQHLFRERLVKINQQVLIKFQVTHIG